MLTLRSKSNTNASSRPLRLHRTSYYNSFSILYSLQTSIVPGPVTDESQLRHLILLTRRELSLPAPSLCPLVQEHLGPYNEQIVLSGKQWRRPIKGHGLPLVP